MNDEQMKVARELAGHPRFEFRDGMRHTDTRPYVRGYGGPYTGRCEDAGDAEYLNLTRNDWKEYGQEHQKLPDLTDDATGGVLLGMVGKGHNVEHYGGVTGASVWIVRERGHEWAARNGPHGFPPNHCGATLAEACARLLLAQWAREVTP